MHPCYRLIATRRSPVTSLHALGAVCWAAGLAACAGAPARVSPGQAWPDQPSDYSDEYERWTRHDTLRDGVDMILDARATLLTTGWRAAFVSKQARLERLSPAETQEISRSEQQQADEYWEITLVIATQQHDWNDLTKNQRSMWVMRLCGAGDRCVKPEPVHRDRRPADVLGHWFRGVGPFHEVYRLRFPKKTSTGEPLWEEGAPLSLRMGSVLGAIEMRW